ncbi:MAG: hypothetical protein Q4B57_00035 [Eubacteriales bacterium]|nr:hypothetical protein [Eubacteriales bacterium]
MSTRKSTTEAMQKLFQTVGFDTAFARADVMMFTGITSSPAGSLIKKLKEAERITPVKGQGKGKYKFVMPGDSNV